MKRLFEKITNKIKNNKRGFSMIELIVVIAIMAVIAVVLVPSLMHNVEDSRKNKDIKTTDELVTAVELALADQEVYDEMLEHAIWDNISCYIDQSSEADCANKVVIKASTDEQTEQYEFNDDERQNDEVIYHGAGNMRGVTITFTPVKDANESHYVLKDAVINKFTGRMTGYLYENEKLYNTIRSVVGDKIYNSSQTYRNSDFTVFIRMGTTGANDAENQDATKIYGQYNGTNLPYDETQTCVMASNRIVSVENQNDVVVNEAINMASNEKIEFSEQSLMGSGVCYVQSNGTAQSIYNSIEKAPTPGLFDEAGNQLKTWQELLDEGSIIVENGVLRGGKPGQVSNVKYNQYDGDRGVLVVDTSVTSIANSAFGGSYSSSAKHSTNLIKVILPNSVTSIGNYAFCCCTSLQNIEFGKGLKSIGKYAFERCTALKSIVIPANITNVGSCAFELCRNVSSITIESGNTKFEDHALYYIDYALTSVVIPDGATTIYSSMFTLCSKLKTVTIPASVTEIQSSAFARSGISEINYGGTMAQWNAVKKYTSSRSSYWNNGCGKITVHCTNGDVTVSACSYNSGFF